MNRIIIEEDLYDHEYVTNQTVAPFLVRDDNGKFLRESDIVSGGDPAKYVFWNKLPAAARAVGAGVANFGDSCPDLFAERVINGISCKASLRRLLKTEK